jgi:DNA repair protein RadC
MTGRPPSSERPRERCLTQGPGCLSLRECLALILGTGPAGGQGALGLAEAVLDRNGAGLAPTDRETAFFTAMEATSAGHAPLQGIRGLGTAGRARILAAFELGRRFAVHREDRGRNPARASASLPERACDRIPMSFRLEAQEWLGFVPLLAAGKLGDFAVAERGVRTHVNVDPAELFARILSLRPRAFFLFHNHPSGDLTPSREDEELTRRVRQVAEALGIRLLGHGIVHARRERWILA